MRCAYCALQTILHAGAAQNQQGFPMAFRKLTLLAAIAAALPSAATPALALGDGPAIASDWADLNVPQAECFARGEAASQRIGFGEVERTKYSRFGNRTLPKAHGLSQEARAHDIGIHHTYLSSVER